MSRSETNFPSEKKFRNKMAIHQCDLMQGHRNWKRGGIFNISQKTVSFQAQVFCFITNMGHQVEDISHKLGIEDVRIMPCFHHQHKKKYLLQHHQLLILKVLSVYCYSRAKLFTEGWTLNAINYACLNRAVHTCFELSMCTEALMD